MYAKIIRTIEYTVNLDSPMWPDGMTPQEQLTAFLEMVRMEPDVAFKCLDAELVSITGELIKGDDHA